MDTKDIKNAEADKVKILVDNGIYTMTLNEEFNSALLKSMEEYHQSQSIQLKQRIEELEKSIHYTLKEFQLTDYHPAVDKILRTALNNKHK